MRALRELSANNGQSLESARQALRVSLLAWQRAQAFRSGPLVETNALLRATFWPPRKLAIGAAIESSLPIDASLVEKLGVDAKGLYALELMLFDDASREIWFAAPRRERARSMARPNSARKATSELVSSGLCSQRIARPRHASVTFASRFVTGCPWSPALDHWRSGDVALASRSRGNMLPTCDIENDHCGPHSPRITGLPHAPSSARPLDARRQNMIRKSVLGAAGLLTLAGSLSFHGCAAEVDHQQGGEQNRAVGGVGAALTLPDGLVINTVNYAITGGPSAITRNGSVNVANSTLLRFREGNLPVGPGYTITLAATTTSGVACAGTASFAVADNQVTTLAMSLVCAGGTTVQVDTAGDVSTIVEVANSAGVTCPVVTGISSLPLEAYVGAVLSVEGLATSTAGVSYAWSSSGGTFSAPTAAATTFSCQTVGDQTLTFAITKTGCNPSSLPVTVTCTALPAATFSSAQAYVIPVAPGVTTKAILTAGDGPNNKPNGTPFRMVGIPDGAGAFDNNDGTFTLLTTQELGNTVGIARAHGGIGAFVSRYIVRKLDLGVLNGSDLIQSVNLWSTASSSYTPGVNVAFNRFCSADLPLGSAFYNASTSTGFNGQLFLNGEEAGPEGRAVAHGLDGVSYELPRLGKAAWENVVASPFAQAKTVVIETDDTTPGEVYVYVGTKTNSGSPVARAGLTNGNLYGIAVTGFATEPEAGGIPSAPFTLVNHGNLENTTGAALQLLGNAGGVTKFNRPEDGAWDPARPSDFYFVTTNAITSPSRLWRLRFTDITQPELGGTLTMLLNGTEGQVMLDNIGIDGRGHIMLQEDPGNNARIAQIFRYDIATGAFTNVAQHNPALFTTGAAGFITQDEESSGIIDASSILGAGWWLLTDQIHIPIAGELVESGQITALFDPASAL